ncbi:MAG: hypothetical protein H0T58_08960 [Gemmatimonadales bacterium]|nr:hypothetical protein [Gemmatimonadales bacterium]
MKRLILTLTSIALVSACSDSDDRGIRADETITRPLEVARVDTTQPLAAVEHQVPKPAEPTVKPSPRKAKRQPRKAVAAIKPAVAAPKEDTSTVQGYAPTPVSDSASPADSVTVPVPDTSVKLAADTVPASAADTAVSARMAPDTAAPPVADTVALNTRDTASRVPTPDTASTAAADRMVGRDSSPAVIMPSPAAVTAALTLPIGTEIHAALDDSISSRTDTTGRAVTAVVMENVTGSDGKTLIPAGAPVRFTVTRLRAARSKSAQGRLALQVEGIGIGGQLREVSADVRPVPLELRGRGVTAGDAAKVGVGAAGGAVIGKVIGKNTKGAVIGGVIGAAGGAVVASQTATRDVVVKARTPVTFVLTQPLVAQ